MKTRLQTKIERKIDFNHRRNEYYCSSEFINDARRYVKAVDDQRMLCVINSVSRMGDSRTMRFLAPEKNPHDKYYNYLNFNGLFVALGYKRSKHDFFIIGGGGMDMVFHTNDSVLRRFETLGIITKAKRDSLSADRVEVL